MSARILALANNPGGVTVVFPVALRLRQQGYEVILWLVDYGCDWCSPNDLPYVKLSPELTRSELEQMLVNSSPEVLLTGTSFSHTLLGDAEGWARVAARNHGIPSVSIVDFWSNYGSRFRFAGEHELTSLPDIVCVLDEGSARAAHAEGIPLDTIRITGSPYLETVPERLARVSPEEVSSFRGMIDPSGSAKVVTFVSQPIAVDYRDTLGWNERDALEVLDRASGALADELSCDIRLVIRPHPREHMANPPAGLRSKAMLYHEPDTYRALLASDFVCGIFSMLLIEARQMRLPCASIQPKHAFDCPFDVTEIGSPDQLMTTMRESFSRPRTPQEVRFPKEAPSAVEEVARLVVDAIR